MKPIDKKIKEDIKEGAIPKPIEDLPAEYSEEDRKIFTDVAQEAAAKATAEIRVNEAKLIDFFKQKGLTVTEINKDEFRDAVLKNVSFESFDYRKSDWDRIQAIK